MSEDMLYNLFAIILAIALSGWLVTRRQRREVSSTGSGLSMRVITSPISQKIRILRSSISSSLLHYEESIRLQTCFEVLAIIVVAIVYTRPLLNFDQSQILTTNEYQAHVGAMSLFIEWFQGRADFPLWNPVVGYGRSLIADPFLFVFNPVLSAPILLAGIVNGSKIAVVLNFFITGLGVWVLTKQLRFTWPARIWGSLLYMLSGAMPAHLTAGQIQLTFALGWLPWSISSFLWVLRGWSWRRLAAAGVLQALFFFTGNLYYQVYALACMLVIGIVFVVGRQASHSKTKVVQGILLLGLISFSLVAIQFLPILTSRSSIRNLSDDLTEDMMFLGSQPPEYALLNYWVSDQTFITSASLGQAPYLPESYRYIGISPFLLLLPLISAYERGYRREIIAFVLCFLLMLAWSGIRYTFIQDMYRAIPLLSQFRWPGRALSVGALFLILLGGYGLNELWRRLRAAYAQQQSKDTKERSVSMKVIYVALSSPVIIGILLSLHNVYKANQELIHLEQYDVSDMNAGLAWLRQHDPAEYAVNTTPVVAELGTLKAYELHLRLLSITDGWIPAVPSKMLGHRNTIMRQPKYSLTWDVETVERADAALVEQIGMLKIWRTPGDFPYAFLVPIGRLTAEPPTISPNEVLTISSARRDGINRIVIDAVTNEDSALVVSESWFTGWAVSVDDHPGEVTSVSRWLAVQLSPGRHRIVFAYEPVSFKIGAAVTGLMLVFLIVMVVREHRSVLMPRT